MSLVLATAATPAIASNEPDASAPFLELQTTLRAQHSERFAGLWLEDEDVVVAAVSGDAAVLGTAGEVYPEPARLRAVPAEYSEAELDRAIAELNAVFEPLAEEQSVHALGVHLPRTRVALEATDPDEVGIAPYVSADVAEMAIVEGGVPPTTLDSGDDAAVLGLGPPLWCSRRASACWRFVGGPWYRRRRGPLPDRAQPGSATENLWIIGRLKRAV